MPSIDREGIFQATCINWWLTRSDKSKAVAVSCEFQITAQLAEDGAWEDWTDYGMTCHGDFYIVKRDGGLNETTITQLCTSLEWDGNLNSLSEPPAGGIVQVTVKADEFNGNVRYKASWLNPGDFVPRAGSVAPEEVKSLQNQYGSLLRAVASKARNGKPQPAAPAKPAAAPQPAAQPAQRPVPAVAVAQQLEHPESTGSDELPF